MAYFAGETLAADALIKQADAALYQAKQRGRNHYWVHPPEAAASALQQTDSVEPVRRAGSP
jgi:tRNA A37 threonylcarbamoyladenosine synthetase subunit TsaC/SUA5/YrdC